MFGISAFINVVICRWEFATSHNHKALYRAAGDAFLLIICFSIFLLLYIAVLGIAYAVLEKW